MGLLVGLPLKLFHIVFVLLRFAWPLLLIALVVWFLRRRRGGGQRPARKRKGPGFDGPVVEVDYEVMDEEEKP